MDENMQKFASSHMQLLKEDFPDLHKNMMDFKKIIFEDSTVDKRTLKLVAIALTAASDSEMPIRKQMSTGIKQFGFTKEEIMDVLKLVLLVSGKPGFLKAVGLMYDELEKQGKLDE